MEGPAPRRRRARGYILQHAASDAVARAFEVRNVPRGSIFVNIVRVLVWSVAALIVLAPLSSRAVTIPLDIDPDADMDAVEADILASVGEATREWRDPALPIDLIAQGYSPINFRMDVRVPLRTIDDGLFARRAIQAACAGKEWLARWEGREDG